MSIGKRIRNIRKNRGLTQQELAGLANISRSYLGDVEGDRYNASLDTLKHIADALKVDISMLVCESEDEEEQEAPVDTDIRRIERARRKMPPRKKEAMMVILETAFAEFFEEDEQHGLEI